MKCHYSTRNSMDLYTPNEGFYKCGEFNGYEWDIVFGGHIAPRCYVQIPESHRLYLNPHLKGPEVHGGITFTGLRLGEEGYWIGWEYNTDEDYVPNHHGGRAWEMKELKEEIQKVILELERDA